MRIVVTITTLSTCLLKINMSGRTRNRGRFQNHNTYAQRLRAKLAVKQGPKKVALVMNSEHI